MIYNPILIQFSILTHYILDNMGEDKLRLGWFAEDFKYLWDMANASTSIIKEKHTSKEDLHKFIYVEQNLLENGMDR